MNDTERAVMLVEAGKRAAEELAPMRDVLRHPEVVLGCGLPVPLVRAIARVMGVAAHRNPHLYGSGGASVIESATMTWEGVTIRCQGSRPMGAEDLPKPAFPPDPLEDDEDPTAKMRRHLAAEYQRQQGEGYGPGREQ